MKKIIVILAACLLLSGCTDNTAESSVPSELLVSSAESAESSVFPVTVCGTEIAEEPQTVVSLSPAVTEILAELGYAERISGKSAYCDYPESLSAKNVGSAENPDIDAIAALSPDVLFTLSGLSERDEYTLSSAGIAVVTLKTPTTIEEYSALYADIASAFAGTEKGAQTGEKAAETLRSAAAESLGSFLYITDKGLAAGQGTFESAVLSLSGSNAVSAEGYVALSDLADIAPECIIAGSVYAAQSYADDIVSQLVNGDVPLYTVTSQFFERPSARTAEIFAEISAQTQGIYGDGREPGEMAE